MAYFINSSDINQTFVMLPTNGFEGNTTVNINGDVQDLSVDREWRVAQGDTGCLTFDGLIFNTTTTIDIGAVTGYIINNETNPAIPTYQYINYSGETNVFVPTLSSGTGTYVLVDNSGIIFQNSFPTSSERKTKIWLGKMGHPDNMITSVINEPDYITSPMAFSRDMFQAMRYINDGVYPYANGVNLKMNITNGSIHGDGINFTNDRTNPNKIQMGPVSTGATFFYRTQSGGTFTISSEIDPTIIDVNGMTASTSGVTTQYVFCVPGIGFVIQFGQVSYPNLAAAISSIGRESFVVYPNLIDNTILIGVLVVNSTTTDLSDTTKAQFFRADKFGQIIGAQAGTSITNLQSAYINSLAPQIVTNQIQGAFQIKGWDSGLADIFQTQNSNGEVTFNINESGSVTANIFVKSGGTSSEFLMADGSTSILDISITGTPNTVPKFNISGSNLTNSNIVDVGTAVTITTDTTIRNITVGRGINSSNFMVGYQNLNPTGATIGSNNFAIGDYALNKLTTGTANIAIGGSAMYNTTVGTDNTAIGRFALYYNTGGTYNVALGGGALQSLRNGTQNMSIGAFSLYQMTGGSGNVAVGISALQKQTVGDSNTAIGSSALFNCTTGIRNTAVGALALYNRLDLPVTGNYNIGVGFQAGRALTSGNNNIMIGLELNDGVTSGSNNIILDPINRSGIVTGNNNTIIGGFNGTIPDGSDRIFIGDGTGNIRMSYNTNSITLGNGAIATASDMFVYGTNAGAGATGSVNAIIMGNGAGTNATNATTSIFMGISAGYGGTSSFNAVYIGQSAGTFSSLARSSVFIGGQAGYNAGSARDSVFIGGGAGNGAASSQNAVYIGNSAGISASQSNQSIFIGNLAGNTANLSPSNVFIGPSAGYQASGNTSNNFIGNQAGYQAKSTSNSNFFGQNAGALTTGNNNSNFIGFQAGNAAIGNNYSNFIGNSAGIGVTNSNYSNLIGYNVGTNNIGNNNIIIGTNISLPNGVTNAINIGGVLFGTNTFNLTATSQSISGQSNGRIGINIVSPTEALEVSGNTKVNGIAKIDQLDLKDIVTTDFKHLTFNANNLRIVNDNLGVTTNITLPFNSTTLVVPSTSGTLALTGNVVNNLTDVTITGTSFTINADNIRYICTSSASTVATVASGVTGNIEVLQYGFGQVSFIGGTGTVLRYSTFSTPSIAEQYASVGLQKLVSAGEIRLFGELSSI